MTPYECNKAYEQLTGFLREHRYNWVVSQVEETVSLGRIRPGRAVDYSNNEVEGRSSDSRWAEEVETHSPRNIEDVDASQPMSSSQRKRALKGRPVEIQQVQQFSPAERLQILLTAIKRTFISIAEMESATATTLQKINPKIEGAILDDKSSDNPVSTDLLKGAERRANAELLDVALRRLRTMAE